MALNPFSMNLENGKSVPTIHIPPGTDLTGLSAALMLPPLRGAVAVVGGAGSFDEPQFKAIHQQVRHLLHELAEIASIHRLAVVDGGTPFGVMRVMGEVARTVNYRFPLIGVAPSGKVAWNANQGINYQGTWYGMKVEDILKQMQSPRTPLDINHTAFVLVEANEWGDEVEMLASVAKELARPNDVLEVLINGGAVARHDIITNLQKGGQVLVVDGSGRFADEVAAAVRTGNSPDADLQKALDPQRVHLFSLFDPPRDFAAMLSKLGHWM